MTDAKVGRARGAGLAKIAAGALMMAASPLAGWGCSGKGGAAPLPIDAAAYAGPGVALVPGTRTHMVTITAPSGGWSVTLDTVRDVFQARRAFVTLTAPGSGELTTRALVEHTLDTGVSLGQQVEVYVRTAPRGEPMPEAYRLAGSSRAER